MDWWEKEPLPIIQALADYIPVLDASDAFAGCVRGCCGLRQAKGKRPPRGNRRVAKCVLRRAERARRGAACDYRHD